MDRPQTPEREVGGLILTRVAVLCPWARHIYSPKSSGINVIPRKLWLCPDMTEKLLTGRLSKKRNEKLFL